MSNRERPFAIISADCHVGAPSSVHREYLESRYHAAYDDELDRWQRLVALHDPEGRELGFRDRDVAHPGDEVWEAAMDQALAFGEGMYESSKRVAALEADGIVGEVIYPGAQRSHVPPFMGVVGAGAPSDPELAAVGARAYNRFLADLCSQNPLRHAGVAFMTALHDIETSVAEARFAGEQGLRGGILLPALVPGQVGWHDESYDPLWRICEEYDLPLNVHGGFTGHLDPTVYGRGQHAAYVAMIESHFSSHRALGHFIVGGVFDRFPKLKLVFTEQAMDWVSYEIETHIGGGLREIDHYAPLRQSLALTPREYWERNCWVGSSITTRTDIRNRAEVGVGNIMFGCDFPHPEGTSPHSRECIRHVFQDVPEHEKRLILGENAAGVYGFDLEALAPAIEAYGPRESDLAGPLDRVPAHAVASMTWRDGTGPEPARR